MAINPNNGVLDIVNGVLKVSSIDIKESGGFATAINTVARNDVLLYDDQHTNTTFLPAEGTDYRSTTGVSRDTSSIDFNDGWVYWPLKLPNSWHAQFDMRITATGGVFTFSLFNTSTPNHTDYTANDGGYKIVFDNTNNQIDVYWEGSVHASASANVRSTDWQHVNINYFRGAVSVSLAGKVVLNHGFTENYQEADSRYIGFSATSGTSHEIRNLVVHNSDKWLYTHTSNASDIAYVSGNVGIGSLTPTELLDVHGNVHIAKDLTVDGNLTVTGTTTFIDTANMSVEDPIIELARGNASDTIDSGLVITRATSNVVVAYRGDEAELALGYTQSGASETDVVPVADGGLDVRVYGNLFANNITTTANVNATYVKGDGSELTQITLDQVVGYGNVTANTIVSTGNIHANYFHGDGSELNNISATLQEITDNSNVTSNTVQFTNSTTALVADSNVGIGTRTPSANLHVVGNQYVNDPPTQSASFDHSDAPLTLTHSTPTSTTAIDDPKAVLHLTRDGTSGESYGAKASFKMSRYENSGTASRSRLDVTLADGTYADTHVMSLRGDGKVGINTTTPGYGLDVHGTANVGALTVTSVAGNGSALSDIQSSNVSDFASNVARIENLESNLSANSLRITNLESGDVSISGEKTFTGDAIFESNIRVKGDLLVANTVNMVVSDPIIELGSNNLNTGDLGIVMTRHGASDSNVAIVFDESGDTLNIGYTSGSAYDTTVAMDGTKELDVKIYGNLHVSNALTINTVAVSITSGLDEVLNVSNSTTNTIQITNTSDTALDVVGGAIVGSNLQVGTANLFVDTTTGNVGVGTSSPSQMLDVSGNVQVGTANLFVDTTTGYVGVGTSSPSQMLDVRGGNAFVEKDVIVNELNGFPISTGHGPIGREDLYTWEGSTNTIVNTLNQQNEPFYYNSDSSFKRLQTVGGSVFNDTGYFTTAWNSSYMFRCDGMDQDSHGNITTPTNYILFSIPVAWLNNKTCSHALFLRFITHDRWSSSCTFVTNSSKTSFYRLQGNTNTHNGSSTTSTGSFWYAPDGGMSMSHLYHEWQMYSIPEYVIEEYSYSETRDGKSKYNRNINIALISGYGNSDGDHLYLSGIAMRTNPYGVTFHNPLCAHWYINGGNGIDWYSGDWAGGILGQINNGSNYSNILIPICPPKDPDVYGYPDFYLGYIGHREDLQFEFKARWYLQHTNGTYKYLGRTSSMYGGKYGKSKSGKSNTTSNLGLYVPSVTPDYIVKVGGRPHLRIRIQNNSVVGWGGDMHPHGFFTEAVYRDSSKDNLGDNGQMFI